VRLPPHPALTRHPAYLAFELATALRRAVDRELRELGLTWPDYAVLAITDALDGPSQEAISNRAGVDRGSLSRLVRDLEYEGLIERRRAQTDQRRILCLATPAGSAAAAEAASAVDEAFHRTLRRLHAKERARLQVLMARAMGTGESRRARCPACGPAERG
jgi:DNA-binding MarR family transcriptional regulator